MSPLSLAGFLGASDSITEHFLSQVYPAIATAISPALFYAGILYWALLGYKVYAGHAPLEARDILAKIVMTCAVFGSLSWTGVATQIYYVFVSFMESAAGTILQGEPAANLLDALFKDAEQVSQTLLNNNFYQINAIIEGSLILILNCLLFTVALLYMTISKFGLAITMVLLPIFIGFAFFSQTRQWFMNWVSKMLNFSLIYILVIAIIKLAFVAFGQYVDEVGKAAGYFEARQITADMVTNLFIVELVLIIFMLQVKGWAAYLSGGATVQGGSLILAAIRTARGGFA